MRNTVSLQCRTIMIAALVGLGLLLCAASPAFGGFVDLSCTDAASGQPVNGVKVTFSGSGVKSEKMVNGRIRLGPFAAGHYKLECWKSGYQPYWINVQVGSGTVAKNIPLSRLTSADIKKRYYMFITFRDKRTNAVLNQAQYTVTGPRGYKKSGQGMRYGAGNLESGEYTLSASCPGYQSLSSKIHIKPGSGVTHYLTAKLEPGRDALGSQPAAKHWVTFVFRDEKTKAALQNVQYQLSGPSFNKSSRANNSVKLGPLVSGRYNVSFKKDGYIQFNSGLEITASRTIDITLAKRSDVTYATPPKNYLAIVPLPEKGNTGVYGANVVVKGPAGTKTATVAKNDASAVFYDLKPGKYTYTVSHSGYQPATGTVNIAANSRETRQVRLNFQTTPVTVRVRYENNDVAKGVEVIASGPAGRLNARTGKDGTARLNLAAGTWTIQSHAYKTEPAFARNVRIPQQKSFDLVLKFPKGNLHISVVDDPSGKRLAGVGVKIAGNRGTFSASTDHNGNAIFKNVPQDTYTCSVFKSGYTRQNQKVPLHTTATAQHRFKIAKLLTGLNVIVKDAATQKPIAGAQIDGYWRQRGNMYKRGKNKQRTLHTAADGTAKFEASRTTAFKTLKVGAKGYKTASFQGVKVPGTKEVMLSRDKPAAAIKADLEIEVVDDRTRKPVGGVMVRLKVGRGHRDYKDASTAANTGVAVFKGLKGGKYSYFVSKPGYAKTLNQTVSIVQSGTLRQTVKISARTPNFKVTVLDSRGRPVTDASVSVQWRVQNRRRPEYERAVSGADGVALLYDVPAYQKILVNAGKKGVGSARKSLVRKRSDKLTLKLAAR